MNGKVDKTVVLGNNEMTRSTDKLIVGPTWYLIGHEDCIIDLLKQNRPLQDFSQLGLLIKYITDRPFHRNTSSSINSGDGKSSS